MMKQTGIKQIAQQRIEILFAQAKKIAKADPKLAAQYILSARRIAMAAKIRLPIEFRRQTCKDCNSLFVHGVNCRVRVKQKREPHVVVTCLNCGKQTRYMTKKKVQKLVEQDNYKDEAAC
ncbi:MAG: ribonuclease P protein component 4 [Candidatus Bathyarchaeia archaeon]|jgi:ribonuclease P protein subunit RPR2